MGWMFNFSMCFLLRYPSDLTFFLSCPFVAVSPFSSFLALFSASFYDWLVVRSYHRLGSINSVRFIRRLEI